MAVNANAAGETNNNIQIGVTLMERFLDCIPSYFHRGQDGKLHHDQRKINVFAHSNKIFGDSYGSVVKVENPAEFQLMKQRLLTQPTFLKVELKREKKSGNTRYITRGDFVIFLNTCNASIKEQLRVELDKCEALLAEGKNFALEIQLAPALKAWYRSRFQYNSGAYTAEGSNFCITNFSQKMSECYNPLVWIGCLPCMLLCGPPYCIYRAVNVDDIDLKINAAVTYIEGINNAERQQLAQMLVRAYVDGMNAASSLNRQPSAPPSYNEAVPEPPKYTPETDGTTIG